MGTDLDLLFRGSPVQRDFLAVGTNFCQVPASCWGLSSPVPHQTVTMLPLELELSPGDGDIGWVQLQHHFGVRKMQHIITTSPLSGGRSVMDLGRDHPGTPALELPYPTIQHLPRTPAQPLTLAIGILLAST